MRQSRILEPLLWTCAVVCGVGGVIAFLVHDNVGALVALAVVGSITAVNASVRRSRRLAG